MRRVAGLSLVEVLVAMLLVLVVTSAALAFVARGRDAQRAGESLARLEESLDDAFAVLADEIRMAGYLGLAASGTTVVGATPLGDAEPAGLAVAGSCVPSLALDLASPIAVADGAYGAPPDIPLGCRPSPRGRHVAGSDVLILRHAASEPSVPVGRRMQIESNLRSARLVADGGGQLGPEARWHDLEVGVYYLSADSTGRDGWPSLRRKRLVGGARPAFQDEELVAGIADLQVELGLDDPADADDAIDRWVAPEMATGGDVARALRLTLEARSDIPEAGQPERMRRKRVTRVIGARNAGAGG